ncbi:MAG: protein kinase [Deltaproteobacteria bacterium]|nr:protein kinase [Deltaproteobacteria bacterium]
MDEVRGAQPADEGSSGPQKRVGTVVNGKWRIDALIGIGGMAVVYAAAHRNGRRAALKVLHPEFARDETIRERFLREGYLGNKVPHEGRVEVFDNDITEDGADFLVMELLLGETIDQIIKRNSGRLPLSDALEVVEQLLDFLAACHAQGIVHRDLKPANIFLTTEGRVKVLDFGVAQHREHQAQALTRAGTAIGTPSYMSPEQARGLGDKLDGRSDIFSVGAILFYVLSGTRLHRGRSNDESLILAATQPAPSLARVAPEQPVEVIALVDKALAWDRRNRFNDAQEMRHEVLRLLGRADLPSAPDQPVELGEIQVAVVEPQGPVAAGEDDPDVVRLRAVLKTLERLLPAVRQYGWAHPETERRLRALFEALLEALQARGGRDPAERPILLDVHPYAFTYRHTPVWEPGAPLDAVPYGLFESGIRGLRVHPGVTEPELRALVEVMLTDPSRDLAPEDDLATMLWDASLEHLECVLESGFAEGTFAQREAFHAQSDALERLAIEAARVAELEAKAMAVSTERDALAESPGKSWGIVDSTTRAALRTQLAVPPERWTERYVDVLVDAYLEARRTGEVALVLDPVRDSCADLIVAHRTPVVLDLHGAAIEVLAMRTRGLGSGAAAASLSDALASELTRSILGANVFELVVHAIRTTPRSSPELAPLSEVLLTALARVGEQELEHALDALVHFAGDGGEIDEGDGQIAEAVEKYLLRVGGGHERAIAARLSHDRLGSARRILSVLVRLGTPVARELVDQVLTGPDVVLRIEALAARGAVTGGAVGNELARLLDHDRDDVRVAALRAIARHHFREIGPVLVRRIQDGGFHERLDVERREMLATLHALHPARAEAVAIELLEHRAVIRSDAREQSRILAARLLGAHARSAAALEAIKQAKSGWFGSSEPLTRTLDEAARAIEARLAAPASSSSMPVSGAER